MHRLQSALVVTATAALVFGMVASVGAQGVDDKNAEPESILFVGNSFTFFNDGVENHVQALAASADPPRALEVTPAAFGGATLATHHQMASLASGAPKQISSGAFDTVVLQGDIPEIPERDIGVFLEHARSFSEEVADAGARPVFFMTWPYERLDWVSLDEIVDAHRQVEAETGASIAPVGVAMANALAERPDLPMLGADAEHESMAGTYLAAATIYATLFDQNPEGLPYHPSSLSEDEAAFLQRIAWQTVNEWHGGAAAE
ncbi:MAG: hypothetical protein AB1Z67_04065 [Candidatus Limnocylindrales bacterium]